MRDNKQPQSGKSMNDRQNEEIEIDDGVDIEDDLDEDDLDDEDRGVVGNDDDSVEGEEERGERVTADVEVEDEETMKGR
jgi:hypothetical protein